VKRALALAMSVLREPALARVEIAFVGFGLAEAGAWVAMLVWAFGEGGTALAGLVGVLQLVPATFLAPFAALLLDRFPRGRVLAGGYLVQAATFALTAVALASEAPVPVVVASAMVLTTSLIMTRPAQGALFPELAREPSQLYAANGLSVGIESVGLAVGPAVAAGVLLVAGPAALFATMAVVLAAGGLLVLPVRGADQAPEGPSTVRGIARDMRLGLIAVARRGTRHMVVLASLPWVVVGAIDVLAVGLTVDLLGLDEAAAGYLLAFVGVGGAIGAGASLGLAARRRQTPIVLAGLMVIASMLALLAAVPGLVAAVTAFFVAGAGIAAVGIASRTLLQRSTDPMLLGRVFGVMEGAQLGSVALGALVAPLLVATVGLSGSWLVLALGCTIAGIVLAPGLMRVDAHYRAPVERLALVHRLSFFADQPEMVKERIAILMRTVWVGAGEVVVREGEPGDAYFALADGSVSVSQRGVEIRRLAAGTGFGEIALLRQVPRTATVTAVTPVRLEVLSRDDFLACISAYPTTGRLADAEGSGYLAADDTRRASDEGPAR
jgi:MFS family permease